MTSSTLALNSLDTLRAVTGPEFVDAAASRYGESEGAVSKALGGAFPLMLSGLLQKTNDTGAMGQIMSVLANRANSAEVLGSAKSLLYDDPSSSSHRELGSSPLSTLFGGRLGNVTSALGDYAGIKSASASSLLTLVSSLIAALLGDRVRTEGLNRGALIDWLNSQRDGILRSVPGVLASTAGLSSLRTGAATVAADVERQASGRWFWPVLIGLALLAAAWALWRNTQVPEVKVPAVAAPAAQAAKQVGQQAQQAVNGAAQQVGVAANNLGAFITRQLPSNVELRVPEHGVESQVVAYLQDPSAQVEPPVWFNFDRLLFETGSATLKPESQEQLKNLAEILTAFPTVKVKIGGYTDNTGDAAANLILSQERAANVMNALVALGVAPDGLSAVGYGEQNPVADNSTDAGRAQNRRIAFRVTEK